MQTDLYERLKAELVDSQERFNLSSRLSLTAMALAILIAFGVIPLPLVMAFVTLGFAAVLTIIQIVIVESQMTLRENIFAEERKIQHVHAPGCEANTSISVVEVKYRNRLIPRDGGWANMGPFELKIPIYERTKCNQCGSEMIWEEKKGRSPVLPEQ